MKKISGIVIADEHFGVIDADKLYNEHDVVLFDFLRELDSLDVIFIAGDFFDHILYLNERHSVIARLTFDRLIFEASRLKSKIRIIYGTESHECNQYNILFTYFYKSDVDIRIIKHVQEEELFKDVYVLYLPEEYIYNKKEYYSEFFTGEKKYDYIIGHGIIQEMMEEASYHLNKSTKDSNRAKVPVFTSTELIENCCGTIYFGHYHINKNIKNKVYYVGSFSRWCFGEDRPKGFYYFKKNNNKYTHEFIENTMADKFITFNYGYDNDIFKSDERLERELKKIENLVKDDIVSHIRLIINIPEQYQNAEGLITMISERFKDSKKIKVKIVNGYINKKQKVNKEYLDNTMKKYSFIFDKSMAIAEQSKNFISTKFGENLETKRIEQHLSTRNVLEIEDE